VLHLMRTHAQVAPAATGTGASGAT
jgi:hypothetical protein